MMRVNGDGNKQEEAIQAEGSRAEVDPILVNPKRRAVVGDDKK